MTYAKRVGRGSLNGRWQANADRRPNMAGVVTLEQTLPAGTRLHIAGWTCEAAGVEFVSLSVSLATRSAPWRERQRERETDEPEGRFG